VPNEGRRPFRGGSAENEQTHKVAELQKKVAEGVI
jgi:hypothetical protein